MRTLVACRPLGRWVTSNSTARFSSRILYPAPLMPVQRSYDAIVVGGGHNGLVCAAYLAKAGKRVAVLERRELVGGASVTESPWPGYRVSTAAYVVSLLQPKIVRDLQLERFGYRVDP